MKFIRHRVNQMKDLDALQKDWGAEIDLRSDASHIQLCHDPFCPGDDFRSWLQRWSQLGLAGPIILNTKEDGLETEVMKMLEEFGLKNWFFLDTALPTLIRWSLREGEHRFAARLSRYEPACALKAFVGKVEWLWIDCFDGVPLDVAAVAELRADFKTCLVSPELQGKPINDLAAFLPLLPYIDAICTKDPLAWSAHTQSQQQQRP